MEVDEPIEAEDSAGDEIEPVGDPVLAYVLDIMEITGVSFDVTLVCGGTLVIGAPVSAEFHHAKVRAFVHEQSANAPIRYSGGEQTDETEAAGIKSLKAMEKLLDSTLVRFGELSSAYLRRSYNLDRKEGGDNTETPSSPTPGDRHYVNLHRVTISRGRANEIDVPFWRGRLSEITGWSLGRWGVGNYEGPDF